MSNLTDVLRKFDASELEAAQQKYEALGHRETLAAVTAELQRRAGEKPVQTVALQDSGRLYQHKFKADDDSGRTFTAYSGDPAVWMKHYMPEAGLSVRLATEEFTGANSPQARQQRAADERALEVGRRVVAAQDGDTYRTR